MLYFKKGKNATEIQKRICMEKVLWLIKGIKSGLWSFMLEISLWMLGQFSSVQSLSCVRLFATPWTVACQASLSITNSQSLLPGMLLFMGSQRVRHDWASDWTELNWCPLSRWCDPTISFSVVPFSSCLQSFPASGSFPMSQIFASCGPSIGVSASTSVLPMNIQDSFPFGWTSWISFQSKGLSRVDQLKLIVIKSWH